MIFGKKTVVLERFLGGEFLFVRAASLSVWTSVEPNIKHK